MLQVFNFEDDSLPKVRRALMFVASVLVLTVVGNLKLDLTVGTLHSEGGSSFDPANFDPAFVLIPILAYLIFRALVTATWYLPLSKVEHTRDNPELQAMALALKEYAQEATRRDAYVAPVQELPVPQVKDLAERIWALQQELIGSMENLSVDSNQISSEGIELNNFSNGRTKEEVQAINDYLNEIRDDIHDMHKRQSKAEGYVKKLEEKIAGFQIFAEKLAELKTQAEEISQLVKANIGSKKLTSVVTAFGRLNSEITLAASRKARIEFWFGLILPLVWALFALWIAREPLRSIITLATQG